MLVIFKARFLSRSFAPLIALDHLVKDLVNTNSIEQMFARHLLNTKATAGAEGQKIAKTYFLFRT